MDKNKKIIFNKIEMFNNLNGSEIKTLSRYISMKKVSAGTILFRENTPHTDINVIYEGEVELFKLNPLGSEKRLAYLISGDLLGEGALEDVSIHSTSARTLSDTKLLTVKKEFFRDNTSAAFKVVINIARSISRRISIVTSRVIDTKVQYGSGSTRKESDLLGERNVPEAAYYGIQTLRGLENFNISGLTLNFYPLLISSIAMVKMAAAKANYGLGLLEKSLCGSIVKACDEIRKGKLDSHFTVDMMQGGAGTTTNMNANEVIANRSLEIMGRERGEYMYCHPNNHVNLSQSTNDVYPTAVKIAIINSNQALLETLRELISSFREKGREFASVIKIGRTQLQDAVPMTLGQSFEAYAVTLDEEILRLEENVRLFLEVNMGATAIGTGINSDPEYAKKVVRHLREITGLKIVSASNLIEATQDAGAFVMYSSALKRTAIKLCKICDDLRLLSSGPRAGFNEINLPPMQPGSSIMPGKVNPVIPEVVNQIAFKVIGNDLTVSLAAGAGQLELNVMLPVITQSIFESIEMLKNGMATLKTRCIDGITANRERCRELVYNSIGLLTALNPVLGYDASNKIAKEALENNRGVYELILEKKLLSKEKLDELLLPENMIAPKKLQKRKSVKKGTSKKVRE